MANISSSCPSIPVLVRNEFLHNQEEGFGEFTKGWIVAIRTVKGLAVTFYVLLENGVLFTGLPIHSLCHKTDAPKFELGDLEMWDSLSYDHSVFQIDFLKGMACNILLRNKKTYDAEYLFSLDFSNQTSHIGIAESPNEWKCFHFLKMKNGCFAIYPQNRIIFKDASLTKHDESVKIGYKVNTTEWGCEDGNKWTVGHDSSYMYGVNRNEQD